MDRQNKSDGKKKVSGSGSRGRGSQSRRGGSSVYQPNFPPHFFPQTGFYNTQPQPNYPPQFYSLPQGPTMVAPGVYEYHTKAQNAFDSFAYRSPPSQSPRDNVEHVLPIYDDDEDEEIVPENPHLDDDEEFEEEEDVQDEVERNGKGNRVDPQRTKKQE
ncbi:hypothetical protein Hanom_Chr12g01147451 [Helianthus anomalus]